MFFKVQLTKLIPVKELKKLVLVLLRLNIRPTHVTIINHTVAVYRTEVLELTINE